MEPLPRGSIRTAILAVLVGAALASPRAADVPVLGDAKAAPEALPGHRPPPVPRGTPLGSGCAVSVAYDEGMAFAERVTLTDLVSDRACPSELGTIESLTFEIQDTSPGRRLWWRRSESGFDVLQPSSGEIPSGRPGRVTLSDHVLSESVTIDVLDGDRKLLSFTVRHF